jgi:prepilin-type N-terminal cleavage/methylation domain-containing protein
MILRLRSGRETQKGFTLIEVIVALAITGLILTSAAMATIQVLKQSTRNNNYTTASRHSMNAIYWVSRDIQMAQVVAPSGDSGFPLTLLWTEWDNSSHNVTYSIVNNELRRSYYIIGGGAPKENLIAQYINWVPGAASNTTVERVVSDNVVMAEVKVTATVGTGSNAVSVTNEREIVPRPSL